MAVMRTINGVFGNNFTGHMFSQSKIDGVSHAVYVYVCVCEYLLCHCAVHCAIVWLMCVHMFATDYIVLLACVHFIQNLFTKNHILFLVAVCVHQMCRLCCFSVFLFFLFHYFRLIFPHFLFHPSRKHFPHCFISCSLCFFFSIGFCLYDVCRLFFRMDFVFGVFLHFENIQFRCCAVVHIALECVLHGCTRVSCVWEMAIAFGLWFSRSNAIGSLPKNQI